MVLPLSVSATGRLPGLARRRPSAVQRRVVAVLLVGVAGLLAGVGWLLFWVAGLLGETLTDSAAYSVVGVAGLLLGVAVVLFGSGGCAPGRPWAGSWRCCSGSRVCWPAVRCFLIGTNVDAGGVSSTQGLAH